MARWPGKIPEGKVIDDPTITMDWSATIRRIAGYPADPEREDGVDLMPLLTGEVKALPERSLFWRRKSGPRRKVNNPGRAVRKGGWKLYESQESPHREFLFNLKDDPGETENLISENPDLADELKELLNEWEADVEPIQ